MALQIRRGPTADRVAKTFAEGEIIYDTQLQEVFIGDGTTLGGKTVSTYTDSQSKDAAAATLTDNGLHSNISFTYDSVTKKLSAVVAPDETYNDLVLDTTPELGGNLSLNGNNITLGNGTVVINGTTGAITANVTGNLTGNADTVTNGVYTNQTFYIGTTDIGITRASGAQTLTGVNIDGNAGTVTNGVYTTGNQEITGILTATGFEGDVYGSVYAADGSTILVNANTNSISADTILAVDLTVSGNLIVNGTTTSINSTTLDVLDKNITIAKGAVDAISAEGAGITIEGANATILYNFTEDSIVINKEVNATGGFLGNIIGDVTGNVSGNAGTVTNGVYTSGNQEIAGNKTFSSTILGDIQGNITTDLISSVTGLINISSPITSTESITAGELSSSLIIAGSINASDGTSTIQFLSAGGIRVEGEVVAQTVSATESIVAAGIYAIDNSDSTAAGVGLYVGSTDIDNNFTSAIELTSTVARIDAPLVIARLTSSEITALVDPLAGTMVYNITTNKFQGYQGGVTPQWVDLS